MGGVGTGKRTWALQDRRAGRVGVVGLDLPASGRVGRNVCIVLNTIGDTFPDENSLSCSRTSCRSTVRRRRHRRRRKLP
jgi:hypothetical protein